MTREIKFRAWNTKDKKWEDDEWVGSQSIMWLNPTSSIYVYSQFTGIKDEEGVDVYEGDIVKNQGKMGGEVFFDDGAFYFNKESPWSLAGFRDLEVIGNIYENPDLIK